MNHLLSVVCCLQAVGRMRRWVAHEMVWIEVDA
jgi:hypothetical protein